MILFVTVAVGLGCAPRPRSEVPSHDELVTDHMSGRYAEVVRWCPQILDDSGADPAQSDWCLFGYPAALRLSLDSEGALAFVRSVCRDLTGAARGDREFRAFYAGEVARWLALPMRLQRQDAALERALPLAIQEIGAACLVDPAELEGGLDTRLPTRREAR